jgi:hypothetical protein
MLRKSLSLLLCLCMVLQYVPTGAFAAEVGDQEPAPVCSCESDDPAYHAPFCALYTAP